MDLKLEAIVLPVSDVHRAKDFYADKLGFNVDVDHQAGESFRVVRLTPPGSACSVTIGTGVSSAAPWSYQGLHLVVEDIEEARSGPRGRRRGLHPERADYGSYVSFEDPDGNGWLVQEVRNRAPGR